jgi:hypothetical protein
MVTQRTYNIKLRQHEPLYIVYMYTAMSVLHYSGLMHMLLTLHFHISNQFVLKLGFNLF